MISIASVFNTSKNQINKLIKSENTERNRNKSAVLNMLNLSFIEFKGKKYIKSVAYP